MVIALSPRAASIKRSLRRTCEIEAFDPTAGTEGYDDAGQEIYAAPRTAACKIAPKFVREARTNGDIIGAWGTVLIFAADDPISDRDRITLTDLPNRGPIVASVTYAFDHRGQLTHKEVLI